MRPRIAKLGLMLAVLTASLFGAGATTAVTQGTITVHGASSGSNLKLSVEGSRLRRKGWMSRQGHRGATTSAGACSPSAPSVGSARSR